MFKSSPIRVKGLNIGTITNGDFKGAPKMKWMKYLLGVLFAVVMTTMFSPTCLYAQVDRGGIKGQAEDTKNASVPGARIALKNEATGVFASAESSSSGEFSFLNLAPGLYTVTAEATGFDTSVQQ